MTETFRLGRIAGIPVGVNWTIAFVAMLLVASLAGNVLPLAEPGLGRSAYLIVGGIAAVGFFASILAHELGHSLVAIRRDVPVDGITLWFLGGVARLRREPTDARSELVIAAAGPATSLGLTVLFGASALMLDATGAGLLAAAAGWLASINLILAVFNLIPAAPLDGGRILAAGLWMAHGDKDRARLTAAGAGRLLGSGLVGLGVWFMLDGQPFALWPVLLGIFILSAANGEREHVRARRALGDLRVREVMTPLPLSVTSPADDGLATVTCDARLVDVIDQIGERDLPVIDESGWVVGLVGPSHLTRLARVGPGGAT